jgi:hypothetical protein
MFRLVELQVWKSTTFISAAEAHGGDIEARSKQGETGLSREEP